VSQAIQRGERFAREKAVKLLSWSLEFHNSPIIKMGARHSSPYCSLTLNVSDIFHRIDFSAANPYQ
jgi:hypothetical protein